MKSYRPHESGHDYYAPGIYLITLVVRNRAVNHSLLGTFNDDLKHPAVILSDVGKAVVEEWNKTPAIQEAKGNKLSLLSQVCMPDHWHASPDTLSRQNCAPRRESKERHSWCDVLSSVPLAFNRQQGGTQQQDTCSPQRT